MDFSDRVMDKMVKILPIFGTFLFGYNAYLQVTLNKDPILSAFSLAVFVVFLLSVISITYGHSMPQGSEKEKAKAMWVIVSIFSTFGAAFLIRAWMVLPTERSWVVPASCALPASALLGFLFLHRRLGNSS